MAMLRWVRLTLGGLAFALVLVGFARPSAAGFGPQVPPEAPLDGSAPCTTV